MEGKGGALTFREEAALRAPSPDPYLENHDHQDSHEVGGYLYSNKT